MAIEITGFKPMDKGALRGFVTIRMTNIGLELRDCTLNEKDGRRWIGLPSKPYEKEDGTRSWINIVSFYDRGMESRFRAAVLAAIEDYLAAPEPDEDIPF